MRALCKFLISPWWWGIVMVLVAAVAFGGTWLIGGLGGAVISITLALCVSMLGYAAFVAGEAGVAYYGE